MENIADVAATQNAIPLIFQCPNHATIFIPDTIAETPLNVVPSGHHLKGNAVLPSDGVLFSKIRKFAPSVPSFSHSIQLLQKNLRRWDWPAFLVMRKPARPSASIETYPAAHSTSVPKTPLHFAVVRKRQRPTRSVTLPVSGTLAQCSKSSTRYWREGSPHWIVPRAKCPSSSPAISRPSRAAFWNRNPPSFELDTIPFQHSRNEPGSNRGPEKGRQNATTHWSVVVGLYREAPR